VAGTRLRIATRGSPLARWQADLVAGLLRRDRPGLDVELVVTETRGDRHLDAPVWELGGQGVFVKEVQAAVLAGRADIAVHSAKDLPSTATPGLVLAAFPVRADPRDALVGATLDQLSDGATVATGSVRRRAQLAAARPDLRFVSVRGNIATRLQRVPPGGALVVAQAALDRLGLTGGVGGPLDPDVVLPQVGQGALAVECRFDDPTTVGLLASIDDPAVRSTVEAERAVLARLGGGCDLPAAAHAVLVESRLVLSALVAATDGTVVVRRCRVGDPVDASALGGGMGSELVAAAAVAGIPIGATP
jgi:hydroxymethylbilane synthase